VNLKKALITIAIICSTLIIFEVFTRYCIVSPAVITYDAELGPMKAPHSSILRTYEGHGEYTNDAYGFNNDALPIKLPKKRLLILGDSFVEAKHVPRPKNFVAQINNVTDVLAYNAGYSAADPRSFPVLMKRFFSIVSPTQIVLVINADDFSVLVSGRLPHYAAPIGFKGFLQPLFAHSALATHLNWKYKPVVQTWLAKWTNTNNEKDVSSSNIDDSKSAKHWAEILDSIKAYSIPILIVAIPHVHYGKTMVNIDDDTRLNTMLNIAIQSHIKVLRLNNFLVKDYLMSGLVAFGFKNSHLGTGHLNARGHHIVAQAILETLQLKP